MPGAGLAEQVAVAGECMEDEDRVVPAIVQFAEGLVGDARVRDLLARLGDEPADVDEATLADRIAVSPSAADRRAPDQRAQLRVGDEVRRCGVLGRLPVHS